MTSISSSATPARTASRSVVAISDSGSPYSRSVRWVYAVASRIATRNASVSVALRHIGWSSRGGPGSTTTVGPSRPSAGGTTSAGAVPTGSMTVAPVGDDGLLAIRRADRLLAQMRPARAHRQHDRRDPLLERLVEHHLAAAELPHDRRREVVGGRSEAAARDDQVDAERGAPLERGAHVLGTVADDRHVREVDAELAQPIGEPGAVAILDSSGRAPRCR